MWSGKISAQPLEIQLLASLLTKKRLRNAKLEQRPRFKEWHWCWWHVLCILWGVHFELQCVCVESEGGCQIQFSYFTHFPLVNNAGGGRLCSLFQKTQTKHTFQKGIKHSTLFPWAPCFLWLRWAIVHITAGGASIHSMSITDRSVGTRHYWNSSAERKEQMFCSFQEKEITHCHHSVL